MSRNDVMMDGTKKPGEILRAARQAAGYTVYNLGDKIDCTGNCVSMFERGRTLFGPALLRRVCDVMRLDYQEMAEMVVEENYKRTRTKYGLETGNERKAEGQAVAAKA